MSQAIGNHTTTAPTAPSRRSALGFIAAATTAALTTPVLAAASVTVATPIGALHRQYRSIDASHAAMNMTLMEMPDGPEHDALRVSFYQLQDDRLTLQDRMLALQAETPEDAAIQVTLCY